MSPPPAASRARCGGAVSASPSRAPWARSGFPATGGRTPTRATTGGARATSSRGTSCSTATPRDGGCRGGMTERTAGGGRRMADREMRTTAARLRLRVRVHGAEERDEIEHEGTRRTGGAPLERRAGELGRRGAGPPAFDHALVAIHDPVLGHTDAAEIAPFPAAIVALGGGREHFHRERALMHHAGRGCHEQHPVNDLVPIPVFREFTDHRRGPALRFTRGGHAHMVLGSAEEVQEVTPKSGMRPARERHHPNATWINRAHVAVRRPPPAA